jgi:CRISPR/Cas system CSM-associated protein Csm3 (group 7 of RAMP superfamily)
VVVEADAPIAVGTGSGDSLRDALFAVGPGGLPYLPATSLAGVLRRAVTADISKREQWFGRVRNNKGDSDVVLSRVVLSDALIHSSANLPQRLDALANGDPVLDFAAIGITRDHVRLNAAGVADGPGKFDDSAVPAGCRFTFEVRVDLDGPADTDECVKALRNALIAPLRIGGKTTRGYGALRPIQVYAREFDLTKSDEKRKPWAALSRDLSQPVRLADLQFADQLPGKSAGAVAQTGGALVRLQLRAQDHLLVGGGSWLPEQAAKSVGTSGVKQPYSEFCVQWQNNKGEVAEQPEPVLPASGVKGALRHRTEFHLRRLLAQASSGGSQSEILESAVTAGMASLFGNVKESGDVSAGWPGRVRIGDVRLASEELSDRKVAVATHVSIDRFTGGPMPGLLFSDVSLFGPEFSLQVELLPQPLDDGQADNSSPPLQSLQVRRALVWALRDLVEGRLALGTGRNAGYGFLRGDLADLNPLQAWVAGAKS